mmetsp:Transcript_25465/g.76475  ORF Transcript_25465/g.76475 Transcript_25465/m.76475 type:complete len:286 (+) Transcript_25465:192-1049(+)
MQLNPRALTAVALLHASLALRPPHHAAPRVGGRAPDAALRATVFSDDDASDFLDDEDYDDYDYLEEEEETCVSIKFVTGNAMKLREVEAILKSTGLPLPLEQLSLDLDEIQGEPEAIAAEKCRRAAEAVGGPAMVDDTSLCLEAIGGMPGPYIKWFGKVPLPRLLDGFESKRAYAQSSIAFSPGPRAVPLVFSGRVHGEIVEPRGGAGFGWDACFLPDGSSETFAEMSAAAKNSLSHRSLALKELSAHLKEDRALLIRLCAEFEGEAQPPEDRTSFGLGFSSNLG